MSCGWLGDKESLVQVELQNENVLDISKDAALEIAKHISKQLAVLMGKHVTVNLGLAIIESGLCGRQDKKNLARLLKAGCSGAHKAILTEADEISKEYSKHRVLS